MASSSAHAATPASANFMASSTSACPSCINSRSCASCCRVENSARASMHARPVRSDTRSAPDVDRKRRTSNGTASVPRARSREYSHRRSARSDKDAADSRTSPISRSCSAAVWRGIAPPLADLARAAGACLATRAASTGTPSGGADSRAWLAPAHHPATNANATSASEDAVHRRSMFTVEFHQINARTRSNNYHSCRRVKPGRATAGPLGSSHIVESAASAPIDAVHPPSGCHPGTDARRGNS